MDLALEVANVFQSDRQLRIADVCTGSGAIAVALAARLPQATVYATDISAFALEATRLNSERYCLQDRLVLGMGSLLDPVPGAGGHCGEQPTLHSKKDIPHLEREVLAEPLEALDGGEDGLDMIKDLIIQALAKLRRPGALIVEISPVQASEVLHLAQSTFPQGEISIHKDLAGRERALLAKAP